MGDAISTDKRWPTIREVRILKGPFPDDSGYKSFDAEGYVVEFQRWYPIHVSVSEHAPTAQVVEFVADALRDDIPETIEWKGYILTHP